MNSLIQNILISLTALSASLTQIHEPKLGVAQICIDQYSYVSEVYAGSKITPAIISDVLTQVPEGWYGNVTISVSKKGFQIIKKTSPYVSPILSDVATTTP